MQLLFPPGDTSWKNAQPQSLWREFNFVFNQIKRAIEPPFSLENMISDWGNISKSLAEHPRKRNVQLLQYFNC
jgi:hypothetical protein